MSIKILEKYIGFIFSYLSLLSINHLNLVVQIKYKHFK